MPLPHFFHRWVHRLFLRRLRRTGPIRRKLAPRRRLLALEQLESLEPPNLLANPLALPFDVSQIRLVDDRAVRDSSGPSLPAVSLASFNDASPPFTGTGTPRVLGESLERREAT